MKWAIIAIVALIVLGGIGYAVYELTSLPEDAQELWDEKRLENFPTHAKREIEKMEDQLAELKETRSELAVERKKLEGGESFGDSNFSTADSGFMTKYGYEKRIEAYMEAGKSLGEAYKNAAAADNAVIDADTGDLANDAQFTVTFTHPKSNREFRNETVTAEEVITWLGDIEENLSTMEYELELVTNAIADYDTVIAEVDKTVEAQELAIKEFKQEVKKIEAELKMIKVKEDLAEINAAINGEESDSKLGKLIAQYEEKKKDFAARQAVADDKSGKVRSFDDMGSSTTSAPKKSRFLD